MGKKHKQINKQASRILAVLPSEKQIFSFLPKPNVRPSKKVYFLGDPTETAHPIFRDLCILVQLCYNSLDGIQLIA